MIVCVRVCAHVYIYIYISYAHALRKENRTVLQCSKTQNHQNSQTSRPRNPKTTMSASLDADATASEATIKRITKRQLQSTQHWWALGFRVTWTSKACRIAFHGCWAIILPTFGGLGKGYRATEAQHPAQSRTGHRRSGRRPWSKAPTPGGPSPSHVIALGFRSVGLMGEQGGTHSKIAVIHSGCGFKGPGSGFPV